LKDRDIQFFRPLWRRIAVIALCAIWAGFELWHGEQLWIVITLGLTAYAVWAFLITFPKEAPAGAGSRDAPAGASKGDDHVPPQS
jgi:hypothetical protein